MTAAEHAQAASAYMNSVDALLRPVGTLRDELVARNFVQIAQAHALTALALKETE